MTILHIVDADTGDAFPLETVGGLTVQVKTADSPSVDAFSRWRVSNPTNVFDAQMTYNLSPLSFEVIVSGIGASVTHDATNRDALITFASVSGNGKAYMQSYEHFRYQPGNGQLIFMTFNFVENSVGTKKFAGYSDGINNGIQFELNGSTKQWTILSNTSLGDETVTQDNWNLDKLDGTGKSGYTLDITKTQILVIDLQALYTGRVRVGFDIDGSIVYCHEFLHSNRVAYPYIQTATLPVICGMTGSGNTHMNFICCAVKTEGGTDDIGGRTTVIEGSVTAASNTRTHLLSLRPKQTFNSVQNRVKFVLEGVDVLVTGNNPVYWELVLGQILSGTTTFTDVNTTYSAVEFNTAGTLSGNPAIVIAAGYVGASNQTKVPVASKILYLYPITLDSQGNHRSMGTLSLLVTGIGSTSTVRASLSWREIR